MAIVKRDLDASEQKDVYSVKVIPGVTNAVFTGLSGSLFQVPYPCTVQSFASAAFGVSNAMQVALTATRFAGGLTVIQLGISNMVLVNFGISAAVSYSGLAAAGSTLLNLSAGDVIGYATSGTNGAASELVLSVVVKKLQDIVSYYGVST